MKKLLYIAVISVVALLAACGPQNPLLGQWESEPMMGMTNSMEFTRSSMTGGGSFGGVSSSNEVKVKDYKIEKDKVAVVLEQNGSEVTMTYNIIDENTIEQDLGFVKTRFHRKK